MHTVVVGQEVGIISGPYSAGQGRVIKVTPSNILVETIRVGGGLACPGGVLYEFDSEGKGCDGRKTIEAGPYEIDWDYDRVTRGRNREKFLMKKAIQELSVGQEVWMESGMYAKPAKVVEITGQYVIVELLRAEGPVGLQYKIRFDLNGKACDSSDIYEGNLWGGPDPRIPGTHEFGPWELVYPAERAESGDTAPQSDKGKKDCIH
jgi:hypothetical protein